MCQRSATCKQSDEKLYFNVVEMMCKLVNQQSALEIDTDVFGGNPLGFHYFMAVFDEAIKKKFKTHVKNSHV